jgi:hypothetical protein
MMNAEARMIITLAAASIGAMPWIPLGPTQGTAPPGFHYRRSAAKRAKLRRKLGR